MTRIDFHSNVPDKVAYPAGWCARPDRRTFGWRRWRQMPRRCSRLDEMPVDVFRPRLPAPCPGRQPAGRANAHSADGRRHDTAELPHPQVLVNLSQQPPAISPASNACLNRFDRRSRPLAGRERYRHYHQRGYPLTDYDAEKHEHTTARRRHPDADRSDRSGRHGLVRPACCRIAFRTKQTRQAASMKPRRRRAARIRSEPEIGTRCNRT